MTNKKNQKILDHIEIHDRGQDRRQAKSGIVLFVNNGQLKKVDNVGSIEKFLNVDQADGTTVVTPGFGTWTTADADRPTWIEVEGTAETDGTSRGEIAVEVDEDGDGTADYGFTVAHIAADNASGTSQKGSTKVYVPAGADYRINNVSDPNAVNALGDVVKVTA